jgi:hypothetical protein
MNQEKSNESIEFAEETSKTRPAPRRGDKELIKEMSTSRNVWYSVHTSTNGTFDNWNTWDSVGSPP